MIALSGITECLETRTKGARFPLDGIGVFILRRGDLSAWHTAIKEATEEVLGREFSFNEIDPRQNEEITALACVNYLVAGWEDIEDVNGNEIPYSLTNAKNMLLPEANFSLVKLLVAVASRSEMFLAEVVQAEAQALKKS